MLCLEDIREYIRRNKANKSCNLILLKEDQEYKRNASRLREIALDSLRAQKHAMLNQEINTFESQKRLKEQISWIQEALYSEQSNSDFVAKI